MIYIILILGLIVIYFSVNGKKIKNTSKNVMEDNFDSLLENTPNQFYEREIVKSYIELEDRLIKLEEKFAEIQEKLEKIQGKDKEEYNYDENKRKDTFLSNNEKKDVVIENQVESINDENINTNVNNTTKNREVITLYNDGRSVEEIASTLKIGKGEVLLRIGLQKRGKQ